MWVYGQLSGEGGRALQGARVTVDLSPPLSVTTDALGWYEIPVHLPEGVTSLELRFEHPTHVAEARRLDATQWAETGEAELDVALKPTYEPRRWSVAWSEPRARPSSVKR